MKRIFCFLLAIVIVVLSGCSYEKEPDIIENEAVLGSVPEASSNSEIEITPAQSSSSSAEQSEKAENSLSSSEESSSEPEKTENSSSSSSSQNSQPSQSSSAASSVVSSQPEASEPEKAPETNTQASSKEETKAVWVSYLEYQTILTGKTEKQFKNSVKNMFANMASDGFNTVFVHVRSHSDAMYDSDIFPWSVYCTGTEGENPGFDPLEIMVEEAHNAGLKIEAWINPYRVKNTADTSKISKENPAYGWLDTEKVVVLEGTGIFYNPADKDVIELVVSGVEEIVKNYAVDGIHFDDYFYPTTAESFDKTHYNEYKSSGGTKKLAAWRRENVNTLIKKVYSAIKAIDPSCRFGVSPAGNMETNYNSLYCDVYTWVTSKGYVDYICPQIYFGFNNKTRPYLTVLDEFGSIITNKNVELMVGLAAYKCGAEDTYAGAEGKAEWQNNSDILARQVTAAKEDSHYGGFAVYRYDSLYNPASSVKKAVNKELENLKNVM